MMFCWWADGGPPLYSDWTIFQVFDGEDIDDEEKSLGKFCGEDTPAPIASTGSTMTVIFYSDEYVEQAGFNATYEEIDGTANPVLSGRSKRDKTEVLKTNGSLMKVESIAECSPWSILQYF